MMEFDRRVTAGNVWTIVVFIFIAGAAWATNSTENAARDRSYASVEVRVTALENNFQSLLRELGSERVKQTEILTRIQTDIQYIKER